MSTCADKMSTFVEKINHLSTLPLLYTMTGKITIENNTSTITVIDIEGVIGLGETLQFETEDARVSTYEKFKQKIDAIQTPEIMVNIRSSGGNVNDALLIHDALIASKKIITTRCYGYVASAATIIAQAAAKGRREMSANALYLIHQSISTSEGNANNLTQTVDLLNKTDERIASIYATRSGKPLEKFIRLMSCNNGNGRWLSPKEAMEEALIDTINPASTIENSALECLSLLGLPALPENKTQKQNPMNIKQHWNAILEILGMNALNEKIPAQNSSVENSIPSSDTSSDEIPDNLACVEAVHNAAFTLENQDARLKAVATAVKPTEDPAPTEAITSANARSYSEDIQNFK